MVISVIVPVFNVEQYLPRCIDSIINQSYSSIDVILIDDGSTDKSGFICDDYSKIDKRIRVIHKENEGQGVARNCGLNLSVGDYILFVDSDDYIKTDMIEKMVRYLDAETDLVLCNGIIDNGYSQRDFSLLDRNGYINKDVLFKMYLHEHKVFTGPVMKLIRSSLMAGIRFPNFRCNEDVYILHEIFDRCKKTYLLAENLYIWQIRSDSTEHRPYYHDKLNLIYANDKLKCYVDKHYPEYCCDVLENKLCNISLLLISIIRAGSIKAFAEDYQFLLSEYDSTYDLLKPSTGKYHLLRYHKQLFLIKETFKSKLSLLKRFLFGMIKKR